MPRLPTTGVIDLAEINKWRALVTDRVEGIVCLDLIAHSENDAKAYAHNAAAEHLKCFNIQNVIVMRWTSLPEEWKRLKQSGRAH